LKTFMAKKEEIERDWYVVDADGQVLGRLASQIAAILRGKHKPEFTPHVDCGDHVVVINAEKVRLTGKKAATKQYFRHTGYPGGLRSVSFQDLIRKRPRAVIERAVWGMLPHNRLGRKMLKKLRVYAGEEHPHQAQKPQTLELRYR